MADDSVMVFKVLIGLICGMLTCIIIFVGYLMLQVSIKIANFLRELSKR